MNFEVGTVLSGDKEKITSRHLRVRFWAWPGQHKHAELEQEHEKQKYNPQHASVKMRTATNETEKSFNGTKTLTTLCVTFKNKTSVTKAKSDFTNFKQNKTWV